MTKPVPHLYIYEKKMSYWFYCSMIVGNGKSHSKEGKKKKKERKGNYDKNRSSWFYSSIIVGNDKKS